MFFYVLGNLIQRQTATSNYDLGGRKYMKKRKKILIAVIGAVVVSSCIVIVRIAVKHNSSKKNVLSVIIADHTYENTEGVVQDSGTYLNFDTTNDNNICYGFESSEYTVEEENQMIGEISALLSYICEEFGIDQPNEMNIYVGKEITTYGITGNAYISSDDYGSELEIVALLQSISNETANYGLCYGLANFIAQKVEYCRESYEGFQNLGAKCDGVDSSLLNLSLPVFQTAFYSQEENEFSYQIAYEFTNWLIEEKGLKIVYELIASSAELDASYENQYETYMNDWLKSINSTVVYQSNEEPIRFVLNHGSDKTKYPYIIQTYYINAYFEPNMAVRNSKEVYDYTYINHYLEMYIQDIRELTEFYSPYFGDDREAIKACFFEDYASNEYFSRLGYLKYNSPLGSGLHEYSHYITYIEGIPCWLTEGIAQWSTYYLTDYCQQRMITEYITSKEDVLKSNNEYMNARNQYLKHVDEKGDSYSELTTFSEISAWLNYSGVYEDAKVSFGQNILINDGDNLTYFEAGSMIHYMIDTYGEKTFFSMYQNGGNLEKYYGKSYDKLYNEWANIMNELFK